MSEHIHVERSVIISPSILSANFARLGMEVERVVEAGADYIHIDVMDGSFVPNITLGAGVVRSIRPVTNAIFDVHLMIENPERHIPDFVQAGADIITFHIEATRHAHRVVQQIKSLGCKVGIALNPATPLFALEEIITDLDMVLIMTVNPGYGGQSFINNMVDKVHALYHIIQESELEVDIQVDGGINADTAKLVREAGANVLVAGSAIYGAEDMAEAIKAIRGYN